MNSRLLAILSLVLVSAPLLAQSPNVPPGMPNPEEQLEKWGRVIYCQKVYAEPVNQSRVYEHDINQCKAAQLTIDDWLRPFNLETRNNLESVAKQFAARSWANTSNPGLVLKACRDACSEIAGERNKPATEKE